MKELHIGERRIGLDFPTYFIADIAANHDGDIERAKHLIRLAAQAGADAAKFQNFKAEKIVSDYGFQQLGVQSSHQKKWQKSVFAVYADASIPDDWTCILHDECHKWGIDYSTAPYDLAAIDHVAQYVDFYKIGSGDINWTESCLRMAKKGKPVLMATGASEMIDVEHAVNAILSATNSLALMQCNTNYTGSLGNFAHINLRVLETYAKRWPGLVLGLSDHTPGHATVLGAVALGARIVEKHFTDDNSRNGPDHAFSLTPEAWRAMVDRTRELEASLGDGIKRVEENERETVVLQRRCLRAIRPLPEGHVLCSGDLVPLRPAPADGFPPDTCSSLIGKVLLTPLGGGEHVTQKHFTSN